MGLTTALFTSLSGLNTNSQLITVTGNNIANSNTHGYKTSRMTFETQISRTLRNASAPTDTSGGVNPSQIGLGVGVGAISRNFQPGSISATGLSTDVAIDGAGFFVVEKDGLQTFTRAGNFEINEDFNLISNGGYVMGYGVDDDFNVVDGVPSRLNINIGVLTVAEATKAVKFRGNLNASGEIATVGSLINSNALYTDDTATTPAVGGDLLTALFDGSGNPLFVDGDVLTISGVQKGGASLPDHTFQVGASNTTTSDVAGETLDDFMTFLNDILGIDTSVDGADGVTLNADGEIEISGNSGTVNDIDIAAANVIKNAGTAPVLPLTFTKQVEADGEAVRTTFVAFDSLGSPLTLDMSMVLEDKTNTGTTWRYYLQSEDDSDLSRVLGTGTVEFDTDGQLISVIDPDVVINRENTGAFTPQQIRVEFTDPLGSVSALASSDSQLAALSQDGSAVGTLEDFSVSEDGTIVGVFSNSLLRDLGRVAVASFANPQGLQEIGDNSYIATSNSGVASIVTAGTNSTGRLVGGALELSNVDLSAEFINLINASTGFTANSRVMSTSDQLIQELLAIIR